MKRINPLQAVLLAMRLSVFLVMLMWTIDKLVNPAHALKIFANFYAIRDLVPVVMTAIAGAELILLLGFVVGWAKSWTYGLVLALHTVSTLSGFRQYLDPFSGANLLFFAAWPMLAACVALFVLRREDRLLAIA